MNDIFLHDTHLHLDLFKEMDEIIKYIEHNKSYTIAVTNLPDLYKRYVEKYKDLKYIRFALGFHPELINDYYNQMKIFDKMLYNSKYIGEIGLDKSKNTKNYDKQKEYFQYIIKKCKNYEDKIISIHSRNTVSDILEIIDNKFKSKIIMHWFSGNIKELEECIQRGYYFSINIQMLNSKKGKNIINKIPISKILIESDEPLATGKQKYQISFIKEIIGEIAKIKSISVRETNDIIKNNFKRLLK